MVMCVLWFNKETKKLGIQRTKNLYWSNTARVQLTIHQRVVTINYSVVTGLSSSRKLFKVFIFLFLSVWTFWNFVFRLSCFHCIVRSSQRSCSVSKGVLRNFAKFTGKHLFQSLYFNKVAGLRRVTLLKLTLWCTWFPVNFAKFLGAPFSKNTSRRLLLYCVKLGTLCLFCLV